MQTDERQREPGSASEASSGSTVLVADDEPLNRDLIAMAVEELPFAVRLITAADGRQALEAARAHRPDLILMDLKMPVVDGWEASRRLKADPATATIPILALTAHAMPGERERALAAGCDAYLTKPLDLPALLAELRQRLG